MSSDESSASSDGTATPSQASAPAGHLAVPRQKGEWEVAKSSRSAEQFPAVADRASVARPGRHNKGSGPALTRSLSRSMPVLGDSGDDLSAEIRTYRQALRSGRRINSPAEDSTTPRASSPSSPSARPVRTRINTIGRATNTNMPRMTVLEMFRGTFPPAMRFMYRLYNLEPGWSVLKIAHLIAFPTFGVMLMAHTYARRDAGEPTFSEFLLPVHVIMVAATFLFWLTSLAFAHTRTTKRVLSDMQYFDTATLDIFRARMSRAVKHFVLLHLPSFFVYTAVWVYTLVDEWPVATGGERLFLTTAPLNLLFFSFFSAHLFFFLVSVEVAATVFQFFTAMVQSAQGTSRAARWEALYVRAHTHQRDYTMGGLLQAGIVCFSYIIVAIYIAFALLYGHRMEDMLRKPPHVFVMDPVGVLLLLIHTVAMLFGYGIGYWRWQTTTTESWRRWWVADKNEVSVNEEARGGGGGGGGRDGSGSGNVASSPRSFFVRPAAAPITAEDLATLFDPALRGGVSTARPSRTASPV